MFRSLIFTVLISYSVTSQTIVTFKAGEPAKADSINKNFNLIQSRLDSLKTLYNQKVGTSAISTSSYDTLSHKLNALSDSLTSLKTKISTSPGSLPSGSIIMWFGDSTTVPLGWVWCNGKNGTPDLRGKFIVGSGNGYAVDSVGGEALHTLTIEEIPAHSHTISEGVYDRSGGGTDGSDYPYRNTTKTTSTVGGSKAHENRPPFYTLAYIMKK